MRLGHALITLGDVEYDLAAGVIRLVRAKDCRKASLAYWAKSQPVSVIDIDWATNASPHTTAEAFLNGARINIEFDSGAGVSTLSLDAAKRAGVTPDSPGVTSAGMTYGVGRELVKTWIGTFASFKIGDEEIRNARLRFGAIEFRSGGRTIDMLLGPDFFLSHRVYVVGRGVAKSRKGLTAEGQADIAAATALAPGIAEQATRQGITP